MRSYSIAKGQSSEESHIEALSAFDIRSIPLRIEFGQGGRIVGHNERRDVNTPASDQMDAVAEASPRAGGSDGR